MSKPVVRVTLDVEEEQVVVGLEWGAYASEHRICVLDAWAILHHLDPHSDDWADGAGTLIGAMAGQVGLFRTPHTLRLEFPHGAVWLDAVQARPLTDRLWELYREYLGGAD